MQLGAALLIFGFIVFMIHDIRQATDLAKKRDAREDYEDFYD